MTTPAIMLGLLITPLLTGTIMNRLAKRTVAHRDRLGCIGIALVFCFTGIGHFAETDAMAEMLPPWVPGRVPLVYITGLFEIAAAFAVLRPRLQTAAGVALIVTLVAFLPANIYAAVNRVGMGGHTWGPIYLLVRVPLQAVLIGWTWWFAVRPGQTDPIRFSCEATLKLPLEAIAAQILDLNRWPDFAGYWFLPGIRSAEFEVRTVAVVGTRIRVTNTDGSTHVEEITEWNPDRRLRLHMDEFSPPLSRLATGFDETWELERDGDRTYVARSLDLHARSALTRPVLWLISRLLKRAIVKHTAAMSAARSIRVPARS